MATAKRRRKRYFVLVRFQLKYIAYILLFLYIGAAVAGYTVYWTTWVTLGEKLANVYPRGRLIYIFKTANITLLLRILLITPVFIVIGTFLSHRIAGPIYRLNEYIESLKNGDYGQRLTLRKKDELKGLAVKLSELSAKLRNEKENRTKKIDDLVVSLQDNKVDNSVIEQVKTSLSDI